ncbi:flagellar brake protein [Pectinatus sottacetonis]|uniref:flagellar brake protein n=1 Tax=Pectinatus sottacetonis TaxID=1002795 RepID=UPI0018C7979E|nr:PilZ domain-containing protein [Pectinatus sottacetonis]
MRCLDIFKTKKILKVGQRVEITEIGKEKIDIEETYTSRVEDIKDNEVSLALPVDYRLCPVIPLKNELIAGRIIEDECVYNFTAHYNKISNIPIPVWIVNISDTVIKSQNREFVRVKTHLSLKLIITNSDGSMGEPFKAMSVDISGNGISFLTDKKIKLAAKLVLDTEPIPLVGRISTFVEVKRCSLTKDKLHYLLGCKFINLPKQIQNKLVKHLFAKQRETINKGIKLK